MQNVFFRNGSRKLRANFHIMFRGLDLHTSSSVFVRMSKAFVASDTLRSRRCVEAGASEQHYINKTDGPNVKFIERDEISDFDRAYTELQWNLGRSKLGLHVFR